MRRRERVVDINLAERRQAPGEAGIVAAPRRRGSGDFPGARPRRGAARPRPAAPRARCNPRRRRRARPAPATSAGAMGRKRQRRVAALRAGRNATSRRSRAPLRASSRMVGARRSMRVASLDLAVLHRHVEIGAQQHRLAAGVDVVERQEFRHGARVNGSGCGRSARSGVAERDPGHRSPPRCPRRRASPIPPGSPRHRCRGLAPRRDGCAAPLRRIPGRHSRNWSRPACAAPAARGASRPARAGAPRRRSLGCGARASAAGGGSARSPRDRPSRGAIGAFSTYVSPHTGQAIWCRACCRSYAALSRNQPSNSCPAEHLSLNRIMPPNIFSGQASPNFQVT